MAAMGKSDKSGKSGKMTKQERQDAIIKPITVKISIGFNDGVALTPVTDMIRTGEGIYTMQKEIVDVIQNCYKEKNTQIDTQKMNDEMNTFIKNKRR